MAGTVPANVVITSATTDNDTVRLKLLAEGPSTFYSPSVEVTGVPALAGEPISVTLTEDLSDKRLFYGEVDITVTETTVVTATSTTGSQAEITITRAAAGPSITQLTIGSLPIGVNSGLQQTEVKQGDIVPVTGTVENSATSAQINATGAAGSISSLTLGADNSAGAGFKTITGTFVVGNGTGSFGVEAQATNSFGTTGTAFSSSNQIVLNQTFPSIAAVVFTYPVGQQAVKGSEAVTADSLVTDFDIIQYTSSADLTVTDPSVYGQVKTITRVGGDYVYGINNYTITAIKASNDALSTLSAAVTIANVAPTASLSIDGNPTRLQSSPAGVAYTVRLDPDQFLLQAPDALVASEGTFPVGLWASSTGDTWVKTLTIDDTHAKGSHLFSGMVITGLSGLQGNVITSGESYEIGGFTQRVITYAAFQQAADIGTLVSDVTKLVASYQDSSTLTFIPNLNNTLQSFSVADRINDDLNAIYDPTNRYLWINDVAFAGSNTTGTLAVVVEEEA